jgi:type IV secretion system protein VirD4
MRPDEWSGHSPIPPSAKLLAALNKKVRDQNGGIRREPELPQHEEVVLKSPSVDSEFDAGPDDSDSDAVQASALNRSMQGLARVVSLDPDDKMGL